MVKNIIKVHTKYESALRRINDLRNALAHTLFTENLKGKKRQLYNGKNIYTAAGLDNYLQDKEEVIDFLLKKAYGIDGSKYDFSVA